MLGPALLQQWWFGSETVVTAITACFGRSELPRLLQRGELEEEYTLDFQARVEIALLCHSSDAWQLGVESTGRDAGSGDGRGEA